MRLPATFVMCCLTTLPAIAQNAARGSADDAAVREIVRQYVDAREKRDAKLLEALFTADADQLVTTGEWRQGRDNVVRGVIGGSARGVLGDGRQCGKATHDERSGQPHGTPRRQQYPLGAVM